MGKNIGNASVKLRHVYGILWSKNPSELSDWGSKTPQGGFCDGFKPKPTEVTQWERPKLCRISTQIPGVSTLSSRQKQPRAASSDLEAHRTRSQKEGLPSGLVPVMLELLGCTRSLRVSGKIWVPLLAFAGFGTWTWYFLGVSRSNTELPATVPLGEPGRRYAL
jgi:hypothetical protein